jgi:hypothetical protein
MNSKKAQVITPKLIALILTAIFIVIMIIFIIFFKDELIELVKKAIGFL